MARKPLEVWRPPPGTDMSPPAPGKLRVWRIEAAHGVPKLSERPAIGAEVTYPGGPRLLVVDYVDDDPEMIVTSGKGFDDRPVDPPPMPWRNLYRWPCEPRYVRTDKK